MAGVWILLAGCAEKSLTPTVAPLTINRIVADVQQAVVTIRTFDPDMEPIGLGTGFFINDQGHLITNHHVLEGAYAATVRTRDGKTYPVVSVLAENASVDLIELSVDIPQEDRRWLKVTEKLPSIADQVVVVGSPLGLEQTVSEGIVSAIRDIPEVGTIFQMSAPISRGSSGSPVVNRYGQVVGIVSFQSQTGQNLNFAVASDNLLKLEKAAAALSLSEWTYERIKDEPRKVQNLCREGFSFSIRGEFKEALSYFQDAVEARPDDTEAWFGLGNCYVGLERPTEAIAAYQEVIRTDPANANAYYNLGHYYRQLERFEEAVATFQEALAANPDHLPARFEMAEVLGRMGRPNEEKRVYIEIIDGNPRFFPAYYRLGLVNNRLGLYPEAIAAQKEVLKLKPDFAHAYFAIGLVYANMGEYRQEVAAYKEALRINPDFVEVHYNMGLYFLRAGERNAALEQYKILRKLDETTADRLFDLIYGDR
ncbi:MAG: tetratricopeptide repeat protein [Desulfobacterales bacterium]|jgi:tetratricopeptide (TPR) repeat protein